MPPTTFPSRLSESQAKRVFAVLTKHAGAREDANDEASFVSAFTAENPPREYRFIGGLGFGGKLRFPRLTVDCYPEDETLGRLTLIGKTNFELAALVQEFQAEQA